MHISRGAAMRTLSLILALMIPGLVHADSVWNMEKLQATPGMKWLDQSAPVHSLFYDGEPYQGHPVDVFAFYASPATIGDASAPKPYPAVVLIHGGGGTAFPEWALLWAKRGYAAIAMDLAGRRPAAPSFDAAGNITVAPKVERPRVERPGPDQGPEEKWKSIGGEISDDWPFHAVGNAIRAHSLIRSFPDVDAERTAVTGISWGGYTTSIVASIDPRFRAAVPVYGCGFLFEGESVQKPQLDALEPERRAEWIRLYDPSSHLGNCRTPILWVNGTNDVHYPLDSYAKSAALVKGPRFFRIEVKMPHGHSPGWKPEEIGHFIDGYCQGGPKLRGLSVPELAADGTATVRYSGAMPAKVQLHYTVATGLRSNRDWISVDATAKDGVITAQVPAEANTWFVSYTDKPGGMYTSQIMLR